MARISTTMALLAGLAELSAAFQLPFLPPRPPDDAPPSRSFELRHALHFGTHRHRGLFLRRDVTPADRAEIDLRAAAYSLIANDVPDELLPELEVYGATQRLRSKRGTVWKPRGTREAWKRARRRSILASRAARGSRNATIALAKLDAGHDADFARVDNLEWEGEEVDVPDVRDLETLRSMAKMTNDAYVKPDDGSWYDPGGKWNVVRMPISISPRVGLQADL